MCVGLYELHSKGILHRDLKPQNVFLNQNHQVKIGDLGVSKELKNS